MEEVDVLDEFAQFTGKKTTRKEAHEKGLWHLGVVIFIVSPDFQRVLLQKRGKNKETWPGFWDVSAGGHVDAGEDAVEAIRRETAEEIGVEIPEERLRYLGTTLSDTPIGEIGRIRHVNVHFAAIMEPKVEDMQLQTEEVEAVKWVEFRELKRRVEHDYEGLTRKDSAWDALVAFVEKQLGAKNEG